MRVILILAVAVGAVMAAPRQSQRIVGGNPTTISNYPSAVALLFSFSGTNYRQTCAGAILNNRSVLTVAHCTYQDAPFRWRFRVGSTKANEDGTVYEISQIIIHNNFKLRTLESDIAIVRTGGSIAFDPNTVQPANIATANLNLGDVQPVHAVGWGATEAEGEFSEELRDVQLWTVNQAVCRDRYAEIPISVTDNMLCAGLLDTGGRDQCQGDAGSPLYYNGIVVGISSFGYGCGHPRYPGVNTRISQFTPWIQINA